MKKTRRTGNTLVSVNKGEVTIREFCEELNEFAREKDRDVSFSPKDFTDWRKGEFIYQLDKDLNVVFVLGDDIPYWFTEFQINECGYERLVDKEEYLYCIMDYLKSLYSVK